MEDINLYIYISIVTWPTVTCVIEVVHQDLSQQWPITAMTYHSNDLVLTMYNVYMYSVCLSAPCTVFPYYILLHTYRSCHYHWLDDPAPGQDDVTGEPITLGAADDWHSMSDSCLPMQAHSSKQVLKNRNIGKMKHYFLEEHFKPF